MNPFEWMLLLSALAVSTAGMRAALSAINMLKRHPDNDKFADFS